MSSSLLSLHLEQIALCSSSIADLHFPPPKPFTNALLAPHDITALIRDTESHERALFSVAPPPVPSKAQVHHFSSTVTTAPGQPRPSLAPSAARQPRRHTAVAAVLGGDMYRRIKSRELPDPSARYAQGPASREKAELDVELLLHGAEKLCAVYPITGAAERISQLRSRYAQLTANIAHYEERVAAQASQLHHINQPRSYGAYPHEEEQEDDYEDQYAPHASVTSNFMPVEHLQAEEDEIRALERKKRALEDHVSGMEKGIGMR